MALSQPGRGSGDGCQRVSILGLEPFCIFSRVVDGDTEGVFVSFVDGSEVEGIACLAGKLRFRTTETEGPN